MAKRLDPVRLNAAMERVHRAGIPGVFGEVRDGAEVWRGAAGFADLDTGAPVTADMRHRVGSVSKTFLAAAVLRQVECGAIGLDTAIGHYLPRLVPGQRGAAVTVRMLLNHTSGLSDYLPAAFPSLEAFPAVARTRPDSLDDNRFTRFDPAELIAMGLAAPADRVPGRTPGVYSNTNYLLLCRILELVTGTTAQRYVTEDVIDRAGLEHTVLPSGTVIDGPHSRLYESWFGMLEPPHEYSVYDMSWVGPAASLISTVADLNRFFGMLLGGDLLGAGLLDQMRRTVPVIALDGTMIDYGLGLHRQEVPGHGVFWGHDGSVWGGGTITMTRADGMRQMAIAINRQRWNELDAEGKPRPHPIDAPLAALYRSAMGGE
ncbi:serine hydrolase domain-containing protein [Sciscionella sediminilitoris]|uniref:serine hydrolase domain-containing protein n=1 Tax=Sciscionella sediminilitoris TaxID=1445613 RepID=UPI0004DFB505|nr:serine hydrolase domain-containing protein [Sciscionella sp. SE31]